MTDGQIFGLIGFAIVVATGLRWYTLIQQVAIPRDRTLLYGFFGVGALFGLLALFNQPGWAVGPLAFLALLVALRPEPVLAAIRAHLLG